MSGHIWTSTLSVRPDGDICLDTVLCPAAYPHTLEPGMHRLMLAATASQGSENVNPALRVPYALQAMIYAPSLYEGLAADLWRSITGAPELERLRGRLFS
jgi:hypothetical protein